MNSFLAQQSPDPATWVAILLGGFVLIYLAFLRPMLKKRKDPLESQTPARTAFSQQRALERDMQHLLVEYEKMIRTMTAGLDTRAAKLEQLIKEADEKLAALRAALQSQANSGLSASPAMSSPAFGQMSPQASGIPEPAPAADPIATEIYALADQGLTVRDVAKRLGVPHGEIELMLKLRAHSVKPSPTSAATAT